MKGSDTVTFTLYRYEYDTSGKTSVETEAIADTVGSYAAVKTYFFDKIIGESFSIQLGGSILSGEFKYNGLTIEFEPGGIWYDG